MTTTSTLEIPPGAPRDWPRMSWAAQDRWLERHAPVPAALPAPVPEAEEHAAPPEAAPPAKPQFDEQGRRVWSEQEMRSAGSAQRLHRRGRGPALTDDQVDAFRAYQRWNWHKSGASARRRAGTS